MHLYAFLASFIQFFALSSETPAEEDTSEGSAAASSDTVFIFELFNFFANPGPIPEIVVNSALSEEGLVSFEEEEDPFPNIFDQILIMI